MISTWSSTTLRLGWRARLPKLYGRAKTSAKTLYDASFAVQGAKLWNALPKNVNTQDNLDTLKVHLAEFLGRISDQPPTIGYRTSNHNSIVNWLNQPGGLREKLTILLNHSIRFNKVRFYVPVQIVKHPSVLKGAI